MATDPPNNQLNSPQGHDGGTPSYFISYSHQDREAVDKIRTGVEKSSQRFRIWFDESIEPGEPFAPKIQKKIDECNAMLFLASRNSVVSPFCLREINLADNKGKTIVPLRLDSKVELPEGKLPLLIQGVQYIDFSDNFEGGLKELCTFLARERREIPSPLDMTGSVEINTSPPPITAGPVVINAPPLRVPSHFLGRSKQHQDIEDFISSEDSALLWILGRAGSGKTTLACRILDQIRRGAWVSPERRVPIHAVAYLNRGHHSKRDWFKLLDEIRSSIPSVPGLRPQKRHLTSAVENLLSRLSDRRVVLLVDHFDDLIDLETRNLTDPYLRDALKAVILDTTHRLKVIVTSRVLPFDLPTAQRGRWSSLNLGEGLPQSEAMQLLRSLDRDGTARLRDGEEKHLAEICRRTQGNPGAIEILHAILGKDLSTSPIDIIGNEKQFLPEDVFNVLIGESYACLDDVSKTMVQVLSVSETEVPSDAVVSVFHHYHPGIDPKQVLSRLLNMQLVQKPHECYLLREVDRRYVASQLADGESSTMGGPEGVHLGRFTLYKQHADYIRQVVSASDSTAEAGSLTRQLEEFHLRYKGEDYVAAVDVLKRLETPLLTQGCGQKLAQCYEQLDGKLEDNKLVRHRLDTLARIYHRLGELKRAAAYYEEGLKCVRDARDRSGECHYLANLAICKQESGELVETTLYCMAALELAQAGDGAWEAHIWNIIGEALASLGQIPAARQASGRALKLARDNPQREIEVVARVNLGEYYGALNNDNQAQEECDLACRIAQSRGFQLGESAARRNLGILKLSSRGQYQLASKDLTEAMRLADVTQSVQLQQTTRIELATALLLDDKLNDAATTVDEAVRYDTPLFNPEAHSLRGVILQRQGKTCEAAESFNKALEQAEKVLKRTSRYYRGLDAMGLSYSGLVLSDTGQYLDEALDAYEASRVITNEPGIVRRRLLLFDALAQMDSEGKLASVREVIARLPKH